MKTTDPTLKRWLKWCSIASSVILSVLIGATILTAPTSPTAPQLADKLVERALSGLLVCGTLTYIGLTVLLAKATKEAAERSADLIAQQERHFAETNHLRRVQIALRFQARLIGMYYYILNDIDVGLHSVRAFLLKHPWLLSHDLIRGFYLQRLLSYAVVKGERSIGGWDGPKFEKLQEELEELCNLDPNLLADLPDALSPSQPFPQHRDDEGTPVHES